MPGRKRPASDVVKEEPAEANNNLQTRRRSTRSGAIKSEPKHVPDEAPKLEVPAMKAENAIPVEDEHMTEYEKQRAAQIARNRQRMAELALPELAAELADISQKEAQTNRHQRSEEKGAANKRARKAERKESAPQRTSLRVRGIKAEGKHAEGIEEELRGGQIILRSGSHGPESSEEEDAKQRHPTGPLPFKSNFGHNETDTAFLEHLRRTATPWDDEKASFKEKPVDRHSAAKLQLQEQHVAKVTKSGTTYMEFRPSREQLMLACGDKDGNVALWDVDYSTLESASEDFDGVMTFPGVHRQYISGLKWAGPSNLVTASYDSSIRLLDINREASSCFVDLTGGLQEGLEISAMDVQTDLQGSSSSGCCSVAYVADKDGDVHIVDVRAGSAVHGKPLDLHNRKINTLHMEPTGAPLLLSASTDSSVKVWDVRKLAAAAAGNGHVQALAAMHHGQSCHAAHWAPDGSKRIVSTSFDNTLKVWNPSGLSLPAPPPAGTPHTTQAANGDKKGGGAGKQSWQGTISKFFGPAASRAAGPSDSPSAASPRKRGPAGSSSSAAGKSGPAGGVPKNAAAAGSGGFPQGEVKGSWSQALSIKHNNQTGRWVTPFKANWGAASDIIIVGNMERGLDIFDASSGSKLAVLSRPDAMTAIPSRTAVHPTRHVLAAATASGRVHMWR